MPLPNLDDKKQEKKPSFGGRPPLESLGLPSLEDDASIEDVDIDDIRYEDEEVYEEEHQETTPKRRIPLLNRSKVREKEDTLFVDSKSEDYIDKKRKRIIPTGGKKSMKEIKAKEFDKRKNVASKARMIRSVVSLGLIIMFALGMKNTFFPSNNYTKDEIEQMVLDVSKNTGFPIERGKQLVEDFTYELLTTDRSNQANNTRLAKYLTSETADGALSLSFMTTEGRSSQKVMMKPTVFEISPVSKNVTRYMVSAVVSDDSGEFEEKSGSTSRDVSHRVSLTMTVFYDPKTDSMSIVRDTVSLTPNPLVVDDRELPSPTELGQEIDSSSEIAEALRPTIVGFIQEYANVSAEKRDGLKQYVPKDVDPKIFNGFDGGVVLNGSPQQAIRYKIYQDGELWKVMATVSWRDIEASNDSVVYNSTYVLTIEQFGEKNLVTKIVPYTYIPKSN